MQSVSPWPKGAPLFVRISATDWIKSGWDLEQSIALARELKQLGVDLIDCSSGGSVPHAKVPIGAGYRTDYSRSGSATKLESPPAQSA